MNRISVVLFDLGNVLVHIDFDATWRELGFRRADERTQFAEPMKKLTTAFECGTVSAEEFLSQSKEVFNGRFTREHLEHAFLSIIREPVEGMEDLVRQVSSVCRTALVSNTNILHYEASVQSVPAMRLLHEHFVSFRMRVMKPDASFYRQIIDAMKIQPDEALFIDDVRENVEGALRAGMQASLFRTVDDLRKDLASRKLSGLG